MALRPGLVERSGLIERLQNASGRVAVIAAPPGFGKSTLLAQWAAGDERTFAFVSLEPSENDPVELWSCVVAAIRQAVPSFGGSVGAMAGSVRGNTLAAMVRQIAAELDQLPHPICIVLDDYHVIRNPVCHESVETLIAHPIGPARLVVSTRADPAIPLARLRAAGELTEIRGRDLAFTSAEAERWLSGTVGIDLSPDDLAILMARTEGWPAGLQLAAFGLRATTDRAEFLRSFGGTNRHVVDYGTEVILHTVPADVRKFLLQTSILSRLCAPLCTAVTGREDSAAMLDQLERSNLFLISLDDVRQWYRYHHLFGEMLREQLRLAGPDEVTGLHRAASAWLCEAGHIDEAIEHAIAAHEPDAAAQIITRNWGSRVASGRITTVLGWLEKFPSERVKRNASLSVVSAWAYGMLGHDLAVRKCVDDLLAADLGGPLPDGSSSVEHAAALIRSMFSWMDVNELCSAARSVREFRDELRPEFRAVATFAIGLAAFLGGNDEEARVELQQAAELAAPLQAWVVVMDALGFGAQVALLQSRADEAEALATRSVEEATARGLMELPHAGYYVATLGAAVARAGRLEEGDKLLESGIHQLADGAPLLAGHARLMRAPVRRQLGDPDDARVLLDEAKGLLARCGNTGIIGEFVPQVARALSASHHRGAERTGLTERELGVLRLLERGLSQRDIAKELFLSYHTIHSHTKSIYTRLDVSSRDEAIERAHELRLL